MACVGDVVAAMVGNMASSRSSSCSKAQGTKKSGRSVPGYDGGSRYKDMSSKTEFSCPKWHKENGCWMHFDSGNMVKKVEEAWNVS